MRTVRRAGLVAIGAAVLLTTAACQDGGSSAGCHDGVCHLTLKGNQSVALDKDHAKVTHIGDDRVTLSWHGLSFTVKEGLTVKIGKYTLRLNNIHGHTAHVDVEK